MKDRQYGGLLLFKDKNTLLWEQRKLGDVVEFYNGDRSSRYPNDRDIVSEGIPFIYVSV